jgi:hypothetical protein
MRSSWIPSSSLPSLRTQTHLYYRESKDKHLDEIKDSNEMNETENIPKKKNMFSIKIPLDFSFLFQGRTRKHNKDDDLQDISKIQQHNITSVEEDSHQNLAITVANQTQLDLAKSHAIQSFHPPQTLLQNDSKSRFQTNKQFDPFASIMQYPPPTTNPNNTTAMSKGRNSTFTTTTSSSIKDVTKPKTYASSSPTMTLNLPLNITDPNTPLTLNDLQRILSSNGYIRREEMNIMLSDSITSSTNPMKPSSDDYKTDKSQQRNIKGVAMPQPTKVSNKHIRYGTMIASGFFFVLIATSIQPNLWLIGSAMGAVYGNDIATKAEMIANGIMTLEDGSGNGVVLTRPGGLYGDVSMKVGKQIATAYLKVFDVFQTFWFLYRTGQLSYEYYQTYAKLDNRYGIQRKIDAWNARFIEGKENFDKWEKENEVGRKLLAGMRTFWMVEENSYKKQMKGMKKSKYKIVRYADNVIGWSKRFFRALWGSISGGGNGELREILKGMKLGMDELSLEIVSQRIGAALAALIAVNFVGAMFAVAPIFLGVAAVSSAVIFPNWLKDTIETVKDAIEEARARGRGERLNKPQVQVVKKPKLPLVEKNSFSYYIGTDGKKKWYRTGQSRFKKLQKENDSESAFQWPWSFTK